MIEEAFFSERDIPSTVEAFIEWLPKAVEEEWPGAPLDEVQIALDEYNTGRSTTLFLNLSYSKANNE